MKFFVDLEKTNMFQWGVSILFYLTLIVSGWYGYNNNFYVITAVLLLWALFIIVYGYLFEKRNIKHTLNDFMNLIDTPIDDLKHKIHGMKIFGYTIYLPKWLMKGSGKVDK